MTTHLVHSANPLTPRPGKPSACSCDETNTTRRRPLMIAWVGLLTAIASQSLQALTVTINEQTLTTESREDCVDLAGDYGSFRIVSTSAGRPPQLCVEPTQGNTLHFRHTAIVANEASAAHGSLAFEHHFAFGPMGLTFMTVDIKGFFAKASGNGIAQGSRVTLTGSFEQAGQTTRIGEPTHTVDATLESALIDVKQDNQYVIAGQRILRGLLAFGFNGESDVLALDHGTRISIETVSARQ